MGCGDCNVLARPCACAKPEEDIRSDDWSAQSLPQHCVRKAFLFRLSVPGVLAGAESDRVRAAPRAPPVRLATTQEPHWAHPTPGTQPPQ